MSEPGYLERNLNREREARHAAEALLEEKSRELYLTNEKLKEQYNLATQHLKKVELFLSITQFFHEPLEFTEQLRYFIKAICEMSAWEVGHVYLPVPDKSDELFPTNLWYCKEGLFDNFKKVTEKTILKRGIGLPGRVFETGKSVWIRDVTEDLNFPRKSAAKENNLKGAFAIPIIIKDKILAIAEFFFTDIAEEDIYLLQIVEAAAEQLASSISVQRKHSEYQEQLKHQVTHDNLTQLPNRVLLMDRLEQAISSAFRNGKKVVVVFIDLDHFKNINDGLGHGAGDQLLVMVSRRLKHILRASDTLARLSGDEFVLLMPNPGKINNLPTMLTRILSSISKPYSIAGQEINVTCSLGFSIYPDDGKDPETLVRNSDAAMYRAKEMGRNTFQFFTPEMHIRITKRLELENGLNHALARNELRLEYQPKLSFPTNQIMGVEALLRWTHPVLGSVPPATFIPVADETGVIIPIGEWVLRTACAQNKAWQDAGLPPITVSVNISPRQFKQRDLIPMIKKILQETKLSPQYLELELTEALAMQNPEEFIKVLVSIKDLGVKLSIDDFGTGYSSLSYLRQFPVDWLKIDQSFVQALSVGENGASIIKAIILLGHSLNMKVIAEGVETLEQFADLKDYHCDEMQGYYISRPVSPEEFYTFLSKKRLPPES